MKKVNELENIDDLFENLDASAKILLTGDVKRLLNGASKLKCILEDNMMVIEGQTPNLSPCIIDSKPNTKYFKIAYYQEAGKWLLKTTETVAVQINDTVKELMYQNVYFVSEGKLCLENTITISNINKTSVLSYQHINHYFNNNGWVKYYEGKVDYDGHESGVFLDDMIQSKKGVR